MTSETALELFRNACGLGAPLGFVCQAASSAVGAYRPLNYPRPFMLIGRDAQADLHLDKPEIGRRHAYLQAVAGRVFCIDLESRTKTYWDGQEVAQSQGWLDPGRFIQVGPYRIHRTDRQPEEPPPSELSDPLLPLSEGGSGPDPLPRPVLELPFRTSGRASTWGMGSLLALVGRSDRCQLALGDSSVSKYHACLVRTPLGLWVVDLAGREGVHVNGTRVRWAWLGDGDLIRLGLFTLVLRYEHPPEGIRRDDIPLEVGAVPSAPEAKGPKAASESPDRDRRSLAVRSEVRRPELMRAEPSLRASLPAAPVSIGRGEWEPVLPPGPNPFAMWQQQMQLMETFHNDMIMMVQMFIAMHREHTASVRDELDRVQQLTRELTRLNTQLGRLPGSSGAGPASGGGRRRPDSGPVPRADAPGPEAKSSPRPRADDRIEKGTAGKPPARTGDPGSTHRPAPTAKDRAKPQARDREKPRPVPPPPMDGVEMYADLTRRITELQLERQGYWQKILKAIGG